MKKRKYPTPSERMDKYSNHIGHMITWGWQPPWVGAGVLLRVSFRADINAVQLWLDTKPFPTMIYDDQATNCSCYESKPVA